MQPPSPAPLATLFPACLGRRSCACARLASRRSRTCTSAHLAGLAGRLLLLIIIIIFLLLIIILIIIILFFIILVFVLLLVLLLLVFVPLGCGGDLGLRGPGGGVPA